MKLLAFILTLTFCANAQAQHGCAENDDECLIQTIADLVYENDYLHEKNTALEKQTNIAEQFADEQRRRAEQAEHENDSRPTSNVIFGLGLVTGVGLMILAGFMVNIANNKPLIN